MKKVGIIFAMQEELESFVKKTKIDREYNIFELTFYECNINGVFCVLVESGVGKVNAARTTQILIDNVKVDYIFNIGVAGGISNNLCVGDIVIGERLVQHDFDITAFNHEKGYIPKVGTYIDSNSYLITLAEEVMNEMSEINSHRGIIASGDIFCTDTKMSEEIANNFNALCVEMEGASVAQVCYLSQIPFLIIRSISDVPNNSNVITYEEFLIDSCNKIANVMISLLNELK